MSHSILEIVTAFSGPDKVSSVVHRETEPEQALETLEFALTARRPLDPPHWDPVIGQIAVNEPDRIVIHLPHPSGSSWDYEFRGTAHDLDILHRGLASLQQEFAKATKLAVNEVVLSWRPTVEDLAAVELGPELSSIER
jgi:hypothetical protein